MAIMQRTVLVVDDDPHIRDLLTFALRTAGLSAPEIFASDFARGLLGATLGERLSVKQVAEIPPEKAVEAMEVWKTFERELNEAPAPKGGAK